MMSDVTHSLSDLVAETDRSLIDAGQTAHALESLQWFDLEAALGEQFVGFSLYGDKYLAPMDQLAEITGTPTVVPLPNLPSWVAGVVNLHGDIVSVVDLAEFLGLERAHAAPGSLLVVHSARADLTIALQVDRVLGLRRAVERREPVQRVSEVVTALSRFVGGDATTVEGSFPIIDLEMLIASPEMQISTDQAA